MEELKIIEPKTIHLGGSCFLDSDLETRLKEMQPGGIITRADLGPGSERFRRWLRFVSKPDTPAKVIEKHREERTKRERQLEDDLDKLSKAICLEIDAPEICEGARRLLVATLLASDNSPASIESTEKQETGAAS